MIEIRHSVFAGRLLPQVSAATAKSPGSFPLKVMLVIVSATFCLLVTVSFFCPLVVPTFTAPKVRVAGASVTGSSPLPLRLMVCGLLLPLSLMVTVPVSAPEVFGENVAVIVQVAPGPMLVPQVFTWLNDELLTEILMPVRATD